MNDSVLEAIGRRHTAKDAVNAFETARKLGFGNINMDVIAGLPTDTPEALPELSKRSAVLTPKA